MQKGGNGRPRRFLKPFHKARSKESIVSGGPSVSRFLGAGWVVGSGDRCLQPIACV